MANADCSVRSILHQDLFIHPYTIMNVQELSPVDYENRMNCSQEMLNGLTFFSSDNAHFRLCVAVHKQNCRYRAKNNPLQIYDKLIHSQK